MTHAQIIWSAQTCPFRRAGAYYGLAERWTHEVVASWLLPRRGAVYSGGTVCVRPGEDWSLNYFAVRDPSAVRVVPVKPSAAGKPRDGEENRDHVSLIFGPSPRNHARSAHALVPGSAAASARNERLTEPAHRGAGFVVTIGLRAELEPEFHRRLILLRPCQPYAHLCDQIMALRDEFSR